MGGRADHRGSKNRIGTVADAYDSQTRHVGGRLIKSGMIAEWALHGGFPRPHQPFDDIFSMGRHRQVAVLRGGHVYGMTAQQCGHARFH